MVELEWCIGGREGERVVACADTAASVVLGVIGDVCSAYPIDAVAEVMTNVGSPLWRAITTEGRAAVEDGREWSAGWPSARVRMRPAGGA